MTILEQLKKWSEKTGGKYETVSTINLRTDKLTVSACGDSLENAYEKIKTLYGDFNEVLKENDTEEKKDDTVNSNVLNSVPSISPTPNLSSMDLNTASTKSLAEALGDRKIVKIYTPGTVLEPGETTITYQNTQYVVK
jgi:hypothetical protein